MAAGKKNPFFAGFLAGLFVGLALAIAVALLVTHSSSPVVKEESVQPAAGATASAPAEAPKYEFYQSPSGEQPGPAAAPAAAAGTRYFLQAGAYGNAAEADQLKARLALLGFEAKIVSAQEGDVTLHKVRIGPYPSLDELNVARARLTQGGMETILIKISPEEKP
jgi:cell division protein FtsN